jgi:hypothetical protein
VGEGDRHRKEYSSKRVAIKPDSPISTLSDETAYTVEIYPSSTFKDEYFTDNALIASLTVALITFFVLLVFIAYDHYVTKREAYLSAMARSSSSIVNQVKINQSLYFDGISHTSTLLMQLFPRFVRDRLFKRTQQKVMSPRKDPGDSFKVCYSTLFHLFCGYCYLLHNPGSHDKAGGEIVFRAYEPFLAKK